MWTISCRAIGIKGQLIFFKLGKKYYIGNSIEDT